MGKGSVPRSTGGWRGSTVARTEAVPSSDGSTFPTKIGTNGNIQGSDSEGGVGYDFLPQTYEGSKNLTKSSQGPTTEPNIPFLPSKPKESL